MVDSAPSTFGSGNGLSAMSDAAVTARVNDIMLNLCKILYLEDPMIVPTGHMPIFSGGDFDSWIDELAIYANLNGWTQRTFTTHLWGALSGDAAILAKGLPDADKTTEGILAMLYRTYGKVRSAAHYEADIAKVKIGGPADVILATSRIRLSLRTAYPTWDADRLERETLSRLLVLIPPSVRKLCITRMPCTPMDLIRLCSGEGLKEIEPKTEMMEEDYVDIPVDAIRSGHRGRGNRGRRGYRGWRTPGTRGRVRESGRSAQKKGACYICDKVGHYAKDCPQKKSYTKDIGQVVYIQRISASPAIRLQFEGVGTMEAIVDLGAAVSVCSEAAARKLHATINATQAVLATANGERMNVAGEIRMKFSWDGKQWEQKFIVARDLKAPILLGMDFANDARLNIQLAPEGARIQTKMEKVVDETTGCQKFVRQFVVGQVTSLSEEEIITDAEAMPEIEEQPVQTPRTENRKIQEVITEFAELFTGKPGVTERLAHSIKLEKGKGIPKSVSRTVPMRKRKALRKLLQDMLDQGIIRRCTQSPFCAPVVIVDKKEPTADVPFRMCIDYRELNKITVKDAYKLPIPDEVQNELFGCKIFSSLDLKSGYWQIKVAEEDIPKTAFSPGSPFGMYECLRMPFGLCNAPATFQRLMEDILADLEFVHVYIDDILVASKSEEEHVEHLRIVLGKLKEAGLTLSPTKCKFGMKEVRYLGNMYSEQGRRTDPDKVKAIVEWTTPDSVKEVRRFLGVVGYYRRYVKNFANIARPLTDLLKTDTAEEFKWTTECDSSFQKLRQELANAPTLRYPNIDEPFTLRCDASGVAIGAVLEQDGIPLAFISRVLTDSERLFPITEKECLAIVWATEYFEDYLLSAQFTVITDHKALEWLDKQGFAGRVGTWKMKLQRYNFVVKYKPGETNIVPDALSRKPALVRAIEVHMDPIFTAEEIRQAQNQDTLTQTIKHLINNHWSNTSERTIPRSVRRELGEYKKVKENLKIWGDILYYYHTKEWEHIQREYSTPVVPACMRERVMELVHATGAACHQGIEKSVAKLQSVAYWAGMATDMEEYIKHCEVCQLSKEGQKRTSELHSQAMLYPGMMWALDILELPTTPRGNRYLLVIEDLYSKWPMAYPMKTMKTSEIVGYVRNAFASFGIPETVLSDQGAQFESQVFKELARQFGFYKVRTTPYHPQADGTVERRNRSLIQIFRSICHSETEWDLWTDTALHAIRTTKQKATGLTPFELMFGREAPCPIFPKASDDTVTAADEFYETMKARLKTYEEIVLRNQVQASARMKEYHQKRHGKHIKAGKDVRNRVVVGDRVLFRNNATTSKLDDRWLGSDEEWIATRIMDDTIQITNMSHTEQVVKVYHRDNVKKRWEPKFKAERQETLEPSLRRGEM